ncbi:MAG: ABC transporter ATP-binding protein [Saccharospirillaceae bacterium]|nr:ABC transporter ATP-binding protein [Pseudomonadales bacterium]NRB79699.1 ABC transporter ATP-binding protein [Saccharospirillaceae bacterium]
MNITVEVQSLSYRYNQTNVLNDVSFKIHTGELICLLGSNGAGKTTLINLILNRLTLLEGQIHVFENDINNNVKSSNSNVAQRIGVMLQDSTAPERATVVELIELFASYYPNPLDTEQLIIELGIKYIEQQRFGKLSGGQKQIVLFALALCGDPDLLFLDEPSVGMDVNVRRTLWKIIEELKSKGKTIILTTHYLGEADHLADRILVLQNGKIIADDTPDVIKARFENKHIKAISKLSIEQIQNLPCVSKAQKVGKFYEVITTNAQNTLKQWFVDDDNLLDLTVTSTNLEQAFIQMMQSDESDKSSDISSKDLTVTSTNLEQAFIQMMQSDESDTSSDIPSKTTSKTPSLNSTIN